MNYTQNQKIEQVTESTLVLGVDIGSSGTLCQSIRRQKRTDKKVFRFSNQVNGFNSL